MACICIRELSCRNLHDAEPHRDEHVLRIVLVDLVVGRLQYAGRQFFDRCRVPDRHPGYHHEQGRRNSLAGNIRDDHDQMVVIRHEKVIEVPADILGRRHAGIDIEFLSVRESRELTGQIAGLDPRGQ